MIWKALTEDHRMDVSLIASVGIDLGKTTFHLVALDCHAKVIVRKKLSRTQLLAYTANLPWSIIGMEACSGAHFFAAKLRNQGHEVKLIPGQFVKPFVKTNKNDFNDAEAIAEAVTRQNMRFVPIKTDDQLDLQALHRVRDRLVHRRTALINQIRGFLLERGIAFPKGPANLRKQMPVILEDAERNMGPLVSTAMVAAIGNGAAFRNGRDFAAWLGLVPRQHSTGGKPRLFGISKRGNTYLRRMFVHGARAVLLRVKYDTGGLGQWVHQLEARTARNKVIVAIANKLARIAWAVLFNQEDYRPTTATAVAA